MYRIGKKKLKSGAHSFKSNYNERQIEFQSLTESVRKQESQILMHACRLPDDAKYQSELRRKGRYQIHKV